jgi:hypothetical protein
MPFSNLLNVPAGTLRGRAPNCFSPLDDFRCNFAQNYMLGTIDCQTTIGFVAPVSRWRILRCGEGEKAAGETSAS